jgi:apolipoprotein N-acyltransferase
MQPNPKPTSLLARLALSAVAGLLGAAAFWPLSLWPLMLVSVALFAWALREMDVGPALAAGFAYGVALAAGTMYWMFNLFGPFAVFLLVIMTAYYGLLASLFAATRGSHPAARACLLALFAVGIEWLRGDAWYLRFPWYTPPHALAAAPPMIAGVRWLGVYGLSFVVWMVAAAGAFRPVAYLGFLALPACWLLLPGEGAPDRRALLFQLEDERVGPQLAAAPPGRYDLAVVPELAYICSPQTALSYGDGPAVLARGTAATVVFGAVEGTYPKIPFFNVAAVAGPDGVLLGTFPKQRPVPLLRDGVPGDRLPVFPVEGGVLGVAVCYDFDAPAVAGRLAASGATVLVAPTMDRMSWGRVQHEHHALLFRLRAVENDRWLLRASSSGRTEVITPRGMPSAEGVEIGGPGHVVVPFAHRDTWALGGRLAFMGPLAAVLTGLYAVWHVVTQPRARLNWPLADAPSGG